MLFFENGHKKEAPSLFCFEPCRQARLTAQCSDGALVFFDLSHIIEIKGVGGLDHQLAGAIFLDVKGVSLIVVSQQFVSWMLRYVVLNLTGISNCKFIVFCLSIHILVVYLCRKIN